MKAIRPQAKEVRGPKDYEKWHRSTGIISRQRLPTSLFPSHINLGPLKSIIVPALCLGIEEKKTTTTTPPTDKERLTHSQITTNNNKKAK